jgi:hypothetical protein
VRRDDPPPGDEAQIDFGYLGTWRDPWTGKKCRLWAFALIVFQSAYVCPGGDPDGPAGAVKLPYFSLPVFWWHSLEKAHPMESIFKNGIVFPKIIDLCDNTASLIVRVSKQSFMRHRRTTSYENVRCFAIYDLTPAPLLAGEGRLLRGVSPLYNTPPG